ncbi:sensor histidine kinase [Massilia orientalis]|uniref:Sensor histidine kinase n=1 Tax=Massilia orientalis TaxID=3050128 RepID=A0ACC7M576_9BURK|nr:HAMP domain-containing sensor histidine kinase [Massilia sp. YIM B02787]
MTTHPPPLAASLEPERQARLATIGQLAASIAHEVDQPLAAIALHAHAALRCIERAQAPAQAHAALCAVLEASQRASAIVKSVRALAGQVRLERTACRLDAAIDDVLAEYAADVRRHAIACRVTVAPGARTVAASPVQLRQLLRNLVGNAVDALSPVRGRSRSMAIRARVGAGAGGEIVVTVRDNGTGMDAATAADAFDPLATTKPHGMGLGLAICRAIVDAHGGRLWLDANPDHGATAGFALPRAAHAHPSTASVEAVHG